MNGLEILEIAVKALDTKKALDINAVKVEDLTIITDYFVMATATSSTHVRALADEVEDSLAKAGVQPHHIEGKATGWILLDFGVVVVHVFDQKSREFYQLERVWSDGEAIDISKIIDISHQGDL